MTASNNIIDILKDLIGILSGFPPGDTTEICAYTHARLDKAGYRTETISCGSGKDNVVARMGSGMPSIVFNAHMDTVAIADREAWETDPLTATVIDDRVYGLGAGNCKGSMAVQIWLAEEIARRGGPRSGEIVFTFVGDEENLGPDGLAFLRETGVVKPDVLICGAQTQLQAITEERGVLWVELTTTGRSAHAGEPQNGDSAIERMIRLIGVLERDLRPRLDARSRGALRSTMNIAFLKAARTPTRCRTVVALKSTGASCPKKVWMKQSPSSQKF